MVISSMLALAACLAAEPLPRSVEPIDAATVVAEADELEQRGRHAAAARRIEALLPDYPQDYGLHLRAGWLRFNAGHWRRGQRHYERAAELSQGSLESRLGIGWSQLRDGRRRAALTTFEALQQDFPESPEVATAREQAEATLVVAPRGWAWLTGQLHPGHPTLRSGLGGQVGLGARIAEHVHVAGSYGFARLGYEPTDEALALTSAQGSGGNGAGGPGGNEDPGGNGGGGGGSETETGGGGSGSGGSSGSGSGSGYGPGYGRGTDDDPFLGTTIDQHQVHASLGVAWPVAGAALRYGWLYDQGLPPVHAVGTSLRVSPWGDVVLDASTTVEPLVTRPRVAASWRMPVHRVLWVQPAVTAQVDGRDALATGRLTVGVHGRRGAIWLGGMAGRERRPALLDVPIVLNLADDLRWGTWVGGTLALPRGLGLLVGYELYGLDPIDPDVSHATAHYLTVGTTFTR